MLWSYDIRQDGKGVTFHGNMLVASDLVLIGTDEGFVYAFEAQTGKVRWKFRTSYNFTSDILRLGTSVYGVSSQDELLSLDLQSGRLRWSFKPPESPSDKPTMLHTSPAVSGSRVFFGGQDGNVYAFSAENGAAEWIQEVGSPAVTPLVISGQHLFLGTEDGMLHRLDKDSGAAEPPVSLGGKPHGLVLLADSLLVFTNWQEESGELLCLDSATGGIRWRQRPPRPGVWNTTRPFLWRGSVLAGTDQGQIRAFRLSDGAEQWVWRLEGQIRVFGGVEDALYVGTIDGRIYAVRPPS